MQNFIKTVVALSAAITLSGCGDTLTEQALIGTGAGVATAAVTKNDLAVGALVGAAANVAYCQQYPSRC